MKKFITILSAIILMAISFTSAYAGNSMPQKFGDPVYENTLQKPSYRSLELGLSVGSAPTLFSEIPDNLVFGLDAVFDKCYIGLSAGSLDSDGLFVAKGGYAFRLNFFEGRNNFDAVVVPYIGGVFYDEEVYMNYGVHTIFKVTNAFGLSLDMSPYNLMFGFSIAW